MSSKLSLLIICNLNSINISDTSKRFLVKYLLIFLKKMKLKNSYILLIFEFETIFLQQNSKSTKLNIRSNI